MIIVEKSRFENLLKNIRALYNSYTMLVTDEDPDFSELDREVEILGQIYELNI